MWTFKSFKRCRSSQCSGRRRVQTKHKRSSWTIVDMPFEVQLRVPIVQSSETIESAASVVKQAVLGARASSC